MQIPIDRNAEKPIYLQIRDRFHTLIESGALTPGDRLPSIRHLAKTVQINKLTVIEAYNLLEAEGFIHARKGSGYFVNHQSILPTDPTNSTFSPTQEVIIPTQRGHSFLNAYLASIEAKNQPDMIDFSFGFAASVQIHELQRIARRAMKSIDQDLFGYDFPQGSLTLRQQIAQTLLNQGLGISAQDLIITNGSLQAIALTFPYFIQPGDWVIVESPTFSGALEILDKLGANMIGIPMTQAGMNLELLEKYLHTYRPKLIYTISTLHNPTGITTNLNHRSQLLKLAEKYACPIIEDNAYEGLTYDPAPPPIKSLDHRHLVIYLGTFSKTLMPGLRVGYMVVTGEHYRPLLERKLLHDFHVSTVSQAILSEYLATGHYRRHIERLSTAHCQKRNTMLKALKQHFPPETSWTVPQGGIFLWVHFPQDIPLTQICQAARKHNILIYPGSAFFPDAVGYNALRLNFSYSHEQIEQGIEILGQLISVVCCLLFVVC